MTSTESPRIVSLLPAATEIVCALGFKDNLVGRSHECDFPPGVETLPVCTHPLIRPDGTSAEIDRQVKDALRDALSIYEVLSDVLVEVKPDVIVTQDQCEVCAVSLKDVESAVCDVLSSEAMIVSLDPQGLDKVWADIHAVAAALDVPEIGELMVASLDARLDALKESTDGSPQPRVACVEWAQPLMAAGNWVPELVTIAGGQDPFGTPGAHAPWMEFERLADTDPDVIVFMPCGFDLARSTAEAEAMLSKPEWQTLSAVRNGRVYATDANSYFNRPGPRLVESAEIMAEVLHPDRRASHQGTGWVRVGSA